MNDHIMLETSTGAYAVSPGLLKRVAYQAAYYGHKNRTKRRKTSKDGWGLPETYHYEFDFKGAKAAANAAANKMMGRFVELVTEIQTSRIERVSRGLGGDLESFREELLSLEQGMRRDKDEIGQALKQASRESMRNIDAKVRGWGIAAQAATITRDVSADVFLVCAGALSGGAAIAGLGIGSVGKGAFKYQDTENVGAAVLEGTTSFVTGVIPVPSAQQVGRVQHYAMVFAKGKIEAGGKYATALVEGKDPVDAAMSVAVSMGTGAVAGRALKKLDVKDLGAVKGMLGDTTLPVSVRLRMGVSGGAVAKVVGQQTGKKLTGVGGDLLLQTLRREQGRMPAVRMPLGDPVLADLAIMGPDVCEPPRRFL